MGVWQVNDSCSIQGAQYSMYIFMGEGKRMDFKTAMTYSVDISFENNEKH